MAFYSFYCIIFVFATTDLGSYLTMRFYPFSVLTAIVLLVSCQGSKTPNRVNEELMLMTSDSTELFVKKAGIGPYCIFVHGGPGAWSKSFEMMGGSALENTFTMVYYDQRGSGRSSSATDYSLKRMVQDIEELRQHLNSDKVFLLSHSFGGILAANYALEYPGKIEGLILANSTLNLEQSLLSQIEYIKELTEEKVNAVGGDSLLMNFGIARAKLEAHNLGYKTLTDRIETFEKLDSIDKTNPSEYHFARSVWNYPEFLTDFTLLTSKINCPTLVIAGTNDRAIGINHHKSFQFPSAKLVELEGSHVLYYENNKAFVETITSFANDLDKNH